MMKSINKACLFLIFAFVISYALAAVYYIIRSGNVDQIGFPIMAAAYMFGPFVSVIIVKKIHGERLFADLSISFKINRWFFVAWLIFPVIVFCTLGISILFPGVTYNPEMTGFLGRFEGTMPPEAIEEFKSRVNSLPAIIFMLIILLQGLFAGITVNAVAGFGEEIGWRGFLLREFRKMHFIQAAIITGFIWGMWHAPLILMGHNYPQHPKTGVLMMTVWCILLTPIFQYITIKSKSVIAAAITHGTLNAVAGFAILAIDGGNDLTTGMPGLPGFITLLIFITGLFIYDCFISREKVMLNRVNKYYI